MKIKSILILCLLYILLFGGCKKESPPINHPPSIQSINLTPVSITPGGEVALSCIAVDSDRDQISYTWTSNDGTLSDPNKPSTTWTISTSIATQTYAKVSLTVSDGILTAHEDRTVSVIAGIVVTGYVYYAGTKIPVSGVTVNIGNSASTTSSDGKYSLKNIMKGAVSLKASKTGYDSFVKDTTLSSNATMNISMTSSTETKRLYGKTQTIDGIILSGIRVTILNPDGSPSTLTDVSDVTGNYQIPSVPQGTKTIKVSKESYAGKCATSQYDVYIANIDKEYNARVKIRRSKNYFDQNAIWEKTNANISIKWNAGGYWVFSCDSVTGGGSIRLTNCIQIPTDAENFTDTTFSAYGKPALLTYLNRSSSARLYGQENGAYWPACGVWSTTGWTYLSAGSGYFNIWPSLDTFIGKSTNTIFDLYPSNVTPKTGSWTLTRFYFVYYW